MKIQTKRLNIYTAADVDNDSNNYILTDGTLFCSCNSDYDDIKEIQFENVKFGNSCKYTILNIKLRCCLSLLTGITILFIILHCVMFFNKTTNRILKLLQKYYIIK